MIGEERDHVFGLGGQPLFLITKMAACHDSAGAEEIRSVTVVFLPRVRGGERRRRLRRRGGCAAGTAHQGLWCRYGVGEA